MTAPAGPTAGQRGFALLIALWALIPLSLLFLALAMSARTDAKSAANLRLSAELEAAADAAIHTTMFDLLRRASPVLQSRSSSEEVSVTVQALSGLVNPNIAAPDLIRALMVRLGADNARATAVAAAVLDWRTPGRSKSPNGAKAADYRAAGRDYGPPGAPFESLDELGQVLGMTPALMDAIRPHLTLYTDSDPDPLAASALVRTALRDAGVAGVSARIIDVVQITAVVRRFDGNAAARRAVIRFGPAANGRGLRVLTWDSVRPP